MAAGTLRGLLALLAVVSDELGGAKPRSRADRRIAFGESATGWSVTGAGAGRNADARRPPRPARAGTDPHVPRDRGGQPGTPNPSLWVAPRHLRSYIRALRRAGYNGVTLQKVWNAWHHGGRLPRRPVVLSFDDGYRGHAAFAVPTLQRAGWPGVLNLKLGNLADMGGARAILRVIHAGWEIDSHTFTHPDLTTLSGEALRHELADSRERLRKLFGVRVSFFCYPSGRYNDAVIAAVKDAGYRAATTTQPGWARPGANPFALSCARRRRDERSSAAAARARRAPHAGQSVNLTAGRGEGSIVLIARAYPARAR